jgi:hypothetical protein
MKFENQKNQSVREIQKIIRKKVTSKQIKTIDFANNLRTHKFSSDEEKNSMLKHYCKVVLTSDLISALFVELDHEPTIVTFKLQNQIRRGMRNTSLLNEFSFGNEAPLPKWYANTTELKVHN